MGMKKPITNYQLLIINLRKSFCCCSLLLLLSSGLVAQDFKREYKKANELYNDGNYSLAMDAFKSLMIYDRNNPYPEYACFYYALSAHRLGFSTVAKEMFIQTKKVYPQWDQLDEVSYWLVKIYLEQREYFHAWQLANQIKDYSFKKDIDALKIGAISNLSDVETLKMLLEENQHDEIISFALAKAIGKQIVMNDEYLLDSLVTEFNWKKEDFISNEAAEPIFKDRYRIALMLPFRTSILDAGPGKKRSQFALDLYQGMKLAADSLLGEGIILDLLAYDTDHDPEEIKKLLKEEELKSADLIVGPLYLEDAKPVQEFSELNKINLVVNPLSYNNDLLGLNPYALLFQPSHSTIGEKSAELVASKVSNKKCLVFYGESPKDSIMAFSFIRTAMKLGVTIVYAEEVRNETSGNILTTLATPTEFDEWKNPKQFKLKLDSIGSVFVASDDPLIYTKVINSIETRGGSVLGVGQENWLEDNSFDLSKFEKIKVALASPNFASVNSQAYIQFRKKYLQTHGVLPSNYAQKGYEFLMVLGHSLKAYGVYFQDGLMKNRIAGSMTFGYQLLPTHDNGLFPFISFKDGRLEPISKP
jgi:ABC-type branched-subunit amino acid transport system substrate-binding protein